MTTVTDCEFCMRLFEADSLLQAEMYHLAQTQGFGVARAELYERYAEIHATHPLADTEDPF